MKCACCPTVRPYYLCAASGRSLTTNTTCCATPASAFTEDGGAAPYDYTAAAQAADDLPGDAGDWELLDMDDFLPQPKPPQPSFRTIPHKTTRRSAHEPQKAKPTE